jgi:predicted GNAT family N-acyltransferase
MPVPVYGGLKVEVGSPTEICRYLFIDAGPGLQRCVAEINGPHILVKATVDVSTLRAAIPSHWEIGPQRYLMHAKRAMSPRNEQLTTLAYCLRHDHTENVASVAVEDPHGQLMACGRMSIWKGCAVFDQIETQENCRRNGLGSIVMLALDEIATHANVHERLLVATEDGRKLYSSLGWEVLADYSTAFLPAISLPWALSSSDPSKT